MKKAFVTGGTGFIGSHLVEELLRRDYGEVRCLIRTNRKWLNGLPIKEVRGDLFDEELVADAVRGVDYVFHNAGVTRAKDWKTFRRSNVDATIRLMDAVELVNPDVQRVVATSSLAAVGRCPSGVATEESELRPVSRYGRSKAEMERALSAYLGRLPIVIIRPSSVYGPREADIYTFFKATKKGICPVVGNVRRPTLSLVHAADLVRGMVDAAEAAGTADETYLLGSETFYSWNDVKDAATKALGRAALTVSIPPALVGLVGAAVEGCMSLRGDYPPLNREKAREIRHACKMCRVDKAQGDFGYRTPTPLDEGVRETIQWYEQNDWL